MKITKLKKLIEMAEREHVTEIRFEQNYKYFDLSNDTYFCVEDIPKFIHPVDNAYILPLDKYSEYNENDKDA